MRACLLLNFLVSFLCCTECIYAQQKSLRLWYKKPALIWEEALPLGNGKTGAMVFGGVATERYQLNDNTLWSGFPEAGNNPNAVQFLPSVRAAVFAGKFDEAAAIWKKMQGPYTARYLPLGDLWMMFKFRDSTASEYFRDLDLNNASARVSFIADGVRFTRETFISHPSKLLVIKISADHKAAINLDLTVTSKLRFNITIPGKKSLVLQGTAPSFVANRPTEPKQIVYDEPAGEGMRFRAELAVDNRGGEVTAAGDQLQVRNADELVIYLATATSFNGFDKSPGLDGKDPSKETAANLKHAKLGYNSLKTEHLLDYRRLFSRVHFELGSSTADEKNSTDERLKSFSKAIAANKDPVDQDLAILYYQFGRYLMIASSRPGGRPTNLQGIWNDHVQPPWGSNYTTNINTEMNYWSAENANLSECHQPLFDFMQELAINGAKTAKINYGISDGWTVHHNTDLWAKTSPPGGYDWDPRSAARWACWPMAGAWFSTHLWQHYLFTGDHEFLLQKAYPLMKGAAQFMLQWLVKDPATGFLVTNPSTSPENTIKINGKEYEISMATTMDMSIIKQLFDDVIRACTVLKIDTAFRQQLRNAGRNLYPYQIGQYGQLQEWFKDWDDPNDKHRHISHLFGLFPGTQFSPIGTSELAAASKQSLIHRGDVSTGWSMAWKINWWARLYDGDHAYSILCKAFNYINPADNKETMSGGGTYPNLFDAHPPFQIDGNFGASAGITEMLLQSHEGFLSLLPALPKAWPKGRIQGIKARGNFEVDILWNGGKIVKAVIKSLNGGTCKIKSLNHLTLQGVQSSSGTAKISNYLLAPFEPPVFQSTSKAAALSLKNETGYTLEFSTEKNKTYTLIAD